MAKDILFCESHEWVKFLNDSEAVVGISEYAAKELGDIVYLDIYTTEAKINETLGDIESVKAVTEFYSPFSGDVVEINQEVIDNPQIINEAPEENWICRILNINEKVKLMDKEEYLATIGE